MKQKKIKLIVVLGMHRSGTSAIARGLITMGVQLGDRTLPPVQGDNDKGYWEDIDVKSLNEEMLSTIGSDWYHVKPVGNADVEKLRAAGYVQRAIALLQSKALNRPVFGFKDPRTAKLLPFWMEIFSQNLFDVSYILAIRNPISVAESLFKRAGISCAHSYLLWLGHVTESLNGTLGKNVVVVDYDLLIRSASTELSRISSAIGLPVIPDEFRLYENEFIDESLRHTSYTIQDVWLADGCPLIVREAYDLLLDVAQEKTTINAAKTVSAIAEWLSIYRYFGEPLRLIDQLSSDKSLMGLRLHNLENEADRLRKKIGDCATALTIYEGNVRELRLENEKLNNVLAATKTKFNNVVNSLTWRLSRPIRIIGPALSNLKIYWRLLRSITATFGVVEMIRKCFSVLKEEGRVVFLRRVGNVLSYYKATGNLGHSIAEVECMDSIDVIQQIGNGGPKISVIISIYKTPIEMLKQAIESVVRQNYKNWELILVDDFSESDTITSICEAYASTNGSIRYIQRKINGNISEANNTGLSISSGAFYTVLDHDDLLAPFALYEVAKILIQNPQLDYIYSDEDKVTKDGVTFFGPFFKPDWSPEYMLAMMYTCHMSVFRTSLVKSLGGYNSKYDGAQDYELTLRVVRHTSNVGHIAKVLYHWRVWESSTSHSMEAKPYAHTRARAALELHLRESNENFDIGEAVLPGHHFVNFYPCRDSLVSIIIPTANGLINIEGRSERHINAVCESIFSKTTYKFYEIIVVHNGDLAQDQVEWLTSKNNVILTEYVSEEFSLSAKINQGASLAKGEYLVIMNDDVRVISDDWLTLMLGMGQREGVGAVGAKLLFPDDTIQHAGVVMLGGLPGHPYYQQSANSLGYGLSLQVNRNYLAVTGACCLTPKLVFDRLGGYSNRYPLNYNDVDYCLRLRKLGFRSVYVSNAILYHYEGVSKEGGRAVASEEIQKFLVDWGKEFRNDPFYNINLNQSIPYAF